MLLQRVIYYFFAVLVLFLWFDKTGIIFFKLQGPAALYAASALFASSCTMVLFLVTSLVYNQSLRGKARFIANLLSVIFASVIPLVVLILAVALVHSHIALVEPVLASLVRAWSTIIPTIWIGWFVIAYLFGDATEPLKKESKSSAASFETIIDTKATLEHRSPSAVTTISRVNRPAWLLIYEVALLRIEYGELVGAKPLLLESIGLLERDPEHNPVDLLTVTQKYADCLLQLHEYQLAFSSYERALSLLNRLPQNGTDSHSAYFSELMAGMLAAYEQKQKDS